MRLDSGTVYVVDDDCSAREAMVGLVRSAGYRAVGHASATEFLSGHRRDPHACLVLDLQMPGLGGLDLQARLNAAESRLPIVFVSGHGDVRTSVTAIKAGAVDFLTKPLDADAFLDAVQRAVASAGAARAVGSDGVPSVGGLLGVSAALSDVMRKVATVAPTDTTVLLQGETGTGKERLARAVHELSQRSRGPFVRVNCAAIPAGLLESELLGHERGAFTGAVSQRQGRFELANEGTLFLDEIGELPLELQPKLLRVLQEREFERVGGARTVRSNARVVAATNRDLKAMVQSREFRADLYYRLSVFPILVPALRDRREDIPGLARHFANEFAEKMGAAVRPLSSSTIDRLVSYHWPGNVRELQNVLERAVILASDGELELHDDCMPEVASSVEASSDALAEVSRAHILRVLHETSWVIAGPNGAAARLRMKRSTLNFRMKKLGIVRPERGPS